MADIKESLERLTYAAGPWIEETRVKLGQGHYGTVYAVKIRGLQCAGKKFDATLFEKPARDHHEGEESTTGQVFVEQCLQLAQVRHPNVVQLLGVLFDSGPTLVSEVLPLNLAKCLEDYQHMPTYAKSSILIDVANGLRYVHEQKKPMAHGRLCPEKILLTISLQAKICGFVNPSGVSLPDSSYTAPEAAEPGGGSRTVKGDVFSYGNLVLHVVTQQYPQPAAKERLDPADAGRTLTCTEAERRDQSLRELGESHALLGLVKRCLEDNPGSRPTMAEVLQEVEGHAVSTPPPYASILQVMQEVEQAALLKDNLSSLTQTLEGKQTELDAKELEVDGLTQELEVKEKALLACKEELDAYKQTVHSKERRMQMHDQALRAKDSLIKAKAREITAKNQQLSAKDSQLAAANRRIATLEERLSSGKGHSLRYPVTPQRSPAFTRSQQVSPTFKESPYKFSQSAEAEDVAMKAGEVLRRSTPGRRGKTVPISDGFFFQNKFEQPKTGIYGQQQVDPKLASILAKRHQRYEQVEAPRNLEPGQQMAGTESNSNQVQLRNRSASATGMSPELQKLMNKRRSQIDMEPTGGAPTVQAKQAPPPTAPRRRQEAEDSHSPPSVEQQAETPTSSQQEQQAETPTSSQQEQQAPETHVETVQSSTDEEKEVNPATEPHKEKDAQSATETREEKEESSPVAPGEANPPQSAQAEQHETEEPVPDSQQEEEVTSAPAEPEDPVTYTGNNETEV
jgi:serine/threonine protein kinase